MKDEDCPPYPFPFPDHSQYSAQRIRELCLFFAEPLQDNLESWSLSMVEKLEAFRRGE